MNERLAKLALITENMINTIPEVAGKEELITWLNNSPYSPYVSLYGGENSLSYDESKSFISELDGKRRYLLEDEISFKLENFINHDDAIYSANTSLSNVINAEELFKAYPEFKNIDIKINISNADNGFMTGSTHHSNNEAQRIEVYATTNSEAMRVLVHELQHCIQLNENFAIGESYYNEHGVMDLFVGLNTVDKNKMKLYHGTDAEFDKFDRMGNRLTSIGAGHYFSPNIKIAEMYGSNIKEIEIEKDLILDLRNPSEEQKENIIKLLNEVVPDNIKAGYGGIQRIDITEMDDDKALKLYREKQEETKDFYHDRAKAQIIEDGHSYFIQWQEAGLENATNANLLNLLQEYRQSIPREMGYKAAMNGEEVAIYDTFFVNELLKQTQLTEGAFSDVATQKSMVEIDDSKANINEINLSNIRKNIHNKGQSTIVSLEYARNQDNLYSVSMMKKDAKSTKDFIHFNLTEEKLAELIPKSYVDKIKLEEGEDYSELYDDGLIHKSISTYFNFQLSEGGKLSDFFSHEKLYELYPHLKEIDTAFSDDFRGAYLSKAEYPNGEIKPIIVIGKNAIGSDVKSMILHELQHQIQFENNWARGGSPEEFEKASELIESEFPKDRYGDISTYNIEDMEDGATYPIRLTNRNNEYIEHFRTTEEAENKIGEILKYRHNRYLKLKEIGSQESRYRKLWGEQQARAVQYRIGMSEEERLKESWTNTLARVEGEYHEPIIKYESGVSYCIEKEIRDTNFKKWFGDSQVVDDNGKPLVVYHGTSADFNKFSQDKNGLIFFTTDTFVSNKFATFSKKGSNVLPVYLSSKNIFDGQIESHKKLFEKYLKNNFSKIEKDIEDAFLEELYNHQHLPYDYKYKNYDIKSLLEKHENTSFLSIRDLLYYSQKGDFRSAAETIDKGDSWKIIENKDFKIINFLKQEGFDAVKTYEFIEDWDKHYNIAVFEPSQIKSIHNQGTFEVNNPNIMEKNDLGLRHIEKVLSIIPSGIDTSTAKNYLMFNGISHEHLRGTIYQECLNNKVFLNPLKNKHFENIDTNHDYFKSLGEVESRIIEDAYIEKLDNLTFEEIDIVQKFASTLNDDGSEISQNQNSKMNI